MDKITISVAVATYNGERYIEQQIQSIVDQTVKVNEIVISDDGSADNTLLIIRNMQKKYAEKTDIDITVLDDNIRHGPCGNFEHAIRHCSGDYIFLCDQDDIWAPDKVKFVVETFYVNKWAECVFHDAILIDKENIDIKGMFMRNKYPAGKLSRDLFLETSVSGPIINGMVMCVSKRLVEKAMPFPKCTNFHDQWLAFCALCMDGLFFLPKKLTYYRLHGANFSGNSAYKGNMIDRIRKLLNKPKWSISLFYDNYYMGRAICDHLEKMELTDTGAYDISKRLIDIGQKNMEAFDSPKIIGFFKLLKLFITDMRFRRIGLNSFLSQLMCIILK